MVDQRIGKAQAAGELSRGNRARRATIGIDGEAGGSIELDALLPRSRLRQRCASRSTGLLSSSCRNCVGFGIKAGNLHLVHDAGAFDIIDMAIGTRCGDHGAHEHQHEIVADGCGFGAEAGIGRWRQQFGLRLRFRLGGGLLASLIILVGLISETGNGSEAAELQRRAGDLAAGTGAKQNRGQRPAASGLSLASCVA